MDARHRRTHRTADQIVSSNDVLLDAHPDLVEFIVKDLIAWKRPDLTQRISNIEAKGAGWISLRRKPFVSIWVRRSQANDVPGLRVPRSCITCGTDWQSVLQRTSALSNPNFGVAMGERHGASRR